MSTLWAALSVDEKNNEGLCAVSAPLDSALAGMMLPLVSGVERRLPWILEKAGECAQATGRQVRVVKFVAQDVVANYRRAEPKP